MRKLHLTTLAAVLAIFMLAAACASEGSTPNPRPPNESTTTTTVPESDIESLAPEMSVPTKSENGLVVVDTTWARNRIDDDDTVYGVVLEKWRNGELPLSVMTADSGQAATIPVEGASLSFMVFLDFDLGACQLAVIMLDDSDPSRYFAANEEDDRHAPLEMEVNTPVAMVRMVDVEGEIQETSQPFELPNVETPPRYPLFPSLREGLNPTC